MTARRSSARGATILEAMVAVALLAIASSGVVALQKAAIVGNRRSRELAVASEIGRTWMERLRMDAMTWNYPAPGRDDVVCGGGAPTAGCMGATLWLKQVDTSNGKWAKPLTVAGRGGAAFDLNGHDVSETDVPPDYCVHVRLNYLYPALVRAEVRVFWPQEKGEGPLGGKFCQEGDPDTMALPANDPLSRYHFAYFTSTVTKVLPP